MAVQRQIKRCLILETNLWETGAVKHQIQFPLTIAEEFFGEGDESTDIQITIRNSKKTYDCSISEVYANSTRRLNQLPWSGAIGHCFVFFEEIDIEQRHYKLWTEYDLAMVVACYRDCEWRQTTVKGKKKKGGQGNRGRLYCIVPAPANDDFKTLD